MEMGSSRPRLVLHFDVNETIMVGDPAGGDTFEDSLNKILAKSAVVRRLPEANGSQSRWSMWCWHDGTPLDPEVRAAQGLSEPPPLLEDFEFSQQPAGCTSFYKVGELRQFAKGFTAQESPGVIYKEVYERLERCLRCDPKMDHRLCHDGCHHFLLPAFFNTLTALRDAGRSYSVIIRTFGTDGSSVVSAIQAFSEGAHSHYAAVPELGESLRDSPLWRGKYVQGDVANSEKFVLEANGKSVSDELMVEEILVKPKERISACCCQDDYSWWRDHGYKPGAGKPIWVTRDDSATHPIFFDDNIHNDAEDSIVAVRARPSAAHGYAPLSGLETVAMQGLNLKRTPTFAAILDDQWFLRQIEACEGRMQQTRADDAGTKK